MLPKYPYTHGFFSDGLNVPAGKATLAFPNFFFKEQNENFERIFLPCRPCLVGYTYEKIFWESEWNRSVLHITSEFEWNVHLTRGYIDKNTPFPGHKKFDRQYATPCCVDFVFSSPFLHSPPRLSIVHIFCDLVFRYSVQIYFSCLSFLSYSRR